MKHGIAMVVDDKITIISYMDYNTDSIYELDSKGEERKRERERVRGGGDGEREGSTIKQQSVSISSYTLS